MGARPSTFRKGGGFLNNVDGLFAAYEWTDAFNGEPFKAGKKADGKPRFHSLYCLITAKVDGAEEEVTTSLFAGGWDDYVVSADGKTLTAPDGGVCSLGANTAAGKFFASFVEGGFPEDRLSDDEASINYEPMEGSRVRYTQRTNAEDTKKLGKRIDKTTKREYDRQDLVIEKVYALPAAAATSRPAPKGAKVSSKPAPKTNGETTEPVDLEAIAIKLVRDIVTERTKKDNKPVGKAKLLVPILQRLNQAPHTDDVVKLAKDDDWLATIEGITYDPVTQNLTLAN